MKVDRGPVVRPIDPLATFDFARSRENGQMKSELPLVIRRSDLTTYIDPDLDMATWATFELGNHLMRGMAMPPGNRESARTMDLDITPQVKVRVGRVDLAEAARQTQWMNDSGIFHGWPRHRGNGFGVKPTLWPPTPITVEEPASWVVVPWRGDATTASLSPRAAERLNDLLGEPSLVAALSAQKSIGEIGTVRPDVDAPIGQLAFYGDQIFAAPQKGELLALEPYSSEHSFGSNPRTIMQGPPLEWTSELRAGRMIPPATVRVPALENSIKTTAVAGDGTWSKPRPSPTIWNSIFGQPQLDVLMPSHPTSTTTTYHLLIPERTIVNPLPKSAIPTPTSGVPQLGR